MLSYQVQGKRLVVKRVKEFTLIALMVVCTLVSVKLVKYTACSYIKRAAATEAAYPYSDGLGKAIDDYLYLDSTGASTKDKRAFCLYYMHHYTDKEDSMSKAGVKHFTRLYISTYLD